MTVQDEAPEDTIDDVKAKTHDPTDGLKGKIQDKAPAKTQDPMDGLKGLRAEIQDKLHPVDGLKGLEGPGQGARSACMVAAIRRSPLTCEFAPTSGVPKAGLPGLPLTGVGKPV